MTKERLLKLIATNGYNIGFGAKKNFASHDIIVKLPSWISFITLAIGIIQLGYASLGNNKELSTTLILVSIASMYIGFYNSSIEKFQKEGDRLIILFNKLRNLYYTVESQNKNDFSTEENEMNNIMTEFYSNNIAKQVYLSQWFAHFKFFYETQIDWIDKELNFKFYKDKVPNSFKSTIIIVIILTITLLIYERF